MSEFVLPEKCYGCPNQQRLMQKRAEVVHDLQVAEDFSWKLFGAEIDVVRTIPDSQDKTILGERLLSALCSGLVTEVDRLTAERIAVEIQSTEYSSTCVGDVASRLPGINNCTSVAA